MTAGISLSRQASAISVMIDVLGGAKTKPKPEQLRMLLEDARAAHATFVSNLIDAPSPAERSTSSPGAGSMIAR